MTEEKTTQPEVENEAAKEEAQKTPENTTGGDAGGDAPADGAEKKDYSQMSDEQIIADLKDKHKEASPEELLLEMAKQQKIIGHKNRAIDSLKKPKEEVKEEPKKPEPEVDDLDKPITKRELVELERKNTVKAMAEKFTSNEDERKAIIDAYENDIVKSGDIARDFNKASAIANQEAVQEYKKNQAISVQNENVMTNYSGGGTGGDPGKSGTNDAVKRAVAANLEQAGFSKEEIDKVV